MALIIEDGSIVAGADSFATRADTITHAANRGITLADDETTDALLRKAADYINSRNLKGVLVEYDQPMAYPRANMPEIQGWTWSSSSVPRQIIYAQMNLAIEINNGDDPFNPPAADMPVVAERVEGAVSVQYANPNSVSKVSVSRHSYELLAPFLKYDGLRAIRS